MSVLYCHKASYNSLFCFHSSLFMLQTICSELYHHDMVEGGKNEVELLLTPISTISISLGQERVHLHLGIAIAPVWISSRKSFSQTFNAVLHHGNLDFVTDICPEQSYAIVVAYEKPSPKKPVV